MLAALNDTDGEFDGQVKQLHELMEEGIRSGEVVPLPYRLFEIEDLEDAMRYLLKGKDMWRGWKLSLLEGQRIP